MINSETIKDKSDSLIELLSAQCGDLEQLLALARQETRAAQAEDFEMVMKIVSEREKISRRLETFQQQISELRGTLTDSAEIYRSSVTARVVELAEQTLAQDFKTKKLLTAYRAEKSAQLANLSSSQRGTNAYLREEKRGLAYDRCV